MVNMILLVIGTIALLVALYFIVKVININNLQPKIIDFITYAERLYDKGQNAEKFDYVFTQIYNILPTPVSLLFTKNQLKEIIQNVFDIVKVALDYKDEGGENG